MAFPTSLTNAVDGSTDVLAEHINNLEAKVGIDSSAVTTSHDYKLSSVTSTAKAVSTAGAQSIAGLKTFEDGIKTDTIAEETSATGVTIDGILLKDDLDTSNIVSKNVAQAISAVKTLTAGLKFTEQAAPDTPAGNDLHLYAKDKSGASALYYKNDAGTEVEVGSGLQTKVVLNTRDLSAATGDVAYTGVGFTPKAAVFFAWVNGTDYAGFGIAGSGITQVGLTHRSTAYEGGISDASTYCFVLATSGSNNQGAKVKTFDADGFTLTWTKTGSPTGTCYFGALCIG